MKRIFNVLAAAMAVFAILCLVTVAIAGEVFDRAVVTLGQSTGTATWTNTADYAAVKLYRVWVEDSSDATSTVSVTRVDGTYTQTVGSVVCTAGDGSTASFTAGYMKFGDKLKFANSTATGAVAIVEFGVQKH